MSRKFFINEIMRLFLILFIIFPCFVYGKVFDISNDWEYWCNREKHKTVNLPYQTENIFKSKKCFFRKKLFLKNKIENLSFILGKVKTFCKVYFNNILVLQVGKIGKNFMEGTKKPIFFTVPDRLIEKENKILIEVMSSDVTIGLYSGPFLFGNFKEIFEIKTDLENNTKYFELFAIGILFLIVAFCIFIYLNGIKDKEYSSFGLFVFTYLVYFLFDSLLFYNLEFKYPIIQKFGISMFLILPVFIMNFFSNTINFRLSNFIKALNFILIFLSIFFFFSKNTIEFITILKIIWLTLAVIYVFRIFYLCFKNLKTYDLPEFPPVIIGLLILCLSGINDLLGLTNSDIFDYGMIIFILFITYALTVRFARINYELRRFSSELIKIRDEERKRLGQELHDGLGQVLVALKLNLQMFLTGKDKFFKKIIDEVGYAINELKNICESLRPAILENLGIVSAIKHFLEKNSNNFKYKFDYDKDLELKKEIEENIFRIFQECLNNTLKHSKANFIKVSLKKEKDRIKFYFSDNGKGLSNEAFSKSKGLGLLSIKERCGIMNARLIINSRKNNGLEIIIYIPYYEKDKDINS